MFRLIYKNSNNFKLEDKEYWKLSPRSKEFSDLAIDDLDREAFGFSREDIKTLNPSQLSIKWKTDLDSVKREQKDSGLSPKEWARRVDLTNPIDVVFERGKFYIDDGHHRYYAAKILGKPLNVSLTIKDKPHYAIVKKAVMQGKNVPSDVLKDYPELNK